MKILPINLDDLIHARSVEAVRREFKKSWSDQILEQTIRTICAFANDFFNLNGGYIIIGVEEKDSLPVLPPVGLEGHNLDEIQKQIRGNCKRLDPEYQPVISPEVYQGKQILVIWVPGGDVRPYQAPKLLNSSERAYYVRQGSESVEAKGDILTQLMQMTAKVPFDDRRNPSVSLNAISPTLVRNFLADIKSDLASTEAHIPDEELYKRLRISARINDHDVPKNIALLFFTNDPAEFFPGARIEIVQFGGDSGGDLIEEQIFRGPIHLQIRQALNYLDSLSTKMIKKIPGQAEAQRTVAFPYEAMKETLVNAFYHRSYEGIYDPIKVYLYPDRMEITSYPGPMPGIEMRHFLPGANMPQVSNRNRRIGEFLKELKLAEGRGTGVPKILRKMEENGSPQPIFDFDETRTYFRVILPTHPQYIVIHALRESAHLWAIGEREKAIQALETAAQRVPHAGALLAQLIEYKVSSGDFATAEKLFKDSEKDSMMMDRHLPFIAMARAFLDNQDIARASAILAKAPSPPRIDELVELAILHKRAERLNEAHKIFVYNYDLIKNDPKALHEYAQTKMKLAASTPKRRHYIRRRLYSEAVELLRRAIQLTDDHVRKAWCWFDLARNLAWLRAPETEILEAYTKALELLPDEIRFKDWHQHQEWKNRKNLDKK